MTIKPAFFLCGLCLVLSACEQAPETPEQYGACDKLSDSDSKHKSVNYVKCTVDYIKNSRSLINELEEIRKETVISSPYDSVSVDHIFSKYIHNGQNKNTVLKFLSTSGVDTFALTECYNSGKSHSEECYGLSYKFKSSFFIPAMCKISGTLYFSHGSLIRFEAYYHQVY